MTAVQSYEKKCVCVIKEIAYRDICIFARLDSPAIGLFNSTIQRIDMKQITPNYLNNRQRDLYTRLVLVAFFVLLAGLWSAAPVHAAAALTITTYGTWDVIGLDSNNVNVGPDHFPVGIEVCNTGDATANNLVSDFHFSDASDPYSGDPYINLHPGSANQETLASLSPGACGHFYYEVQVTRNSNAYENTRGYYITVDSDETAEISTPTPRQLFIEHLISQNRNTIKDVLLDGVSITPGGTMIVTVGNTYTIRVIGATATQGYNQLESFINLPNSIFRILDIETTYAANSSSSTLVPTPNPSLYANACGWDPVPTSPTYRNCIVDSLWKAGGDPVITDYTVLIVAGGGTTETLNSLLYDFSGSSYHYNSDFDAGYRIVSILDPAQFTMDKSFTPGTVFQNGTSTLSFTLNNPYGSVVNGFNFTDTLPTHLVIANPANVSTSGCGTPTIVAVAGTDDISFSDGTVAPNSSCVFALDVLADATAGTWTNTSANLFIGTADTGDNATANLTVSGTPPAPSGCSGATMAKWTFTGFTTNPPPFPAPNLKSNDVATADISVGGSNPGSLVAEADASEGNPLPSIATYGWNTASGSTATDPYIQFLIDTSNYTGVTLTFDELATAPGPTDMYIYYSTDGTTFTQLGSSIPTSGSWTPHGPLDFTGVTNAGGNTYFRIYGSGANNPNSGSDLNFDNVTFSGNGACAPAVLTKSFSPDPIAVNATSRLTFILTNPNPSNALTGATFIDSLPAGLRVANPPDYDTNCAGALWTPAATDTVLNFSGGTIPAGGSCYARVEIEATSSGPHLNVSGYLATTEGGVNTSSTTTATLTALLPPVIDKTFIPNPILANGESSLVFSVTNPNPNNIISTVIFTDDLPSSPDQMTFIPASPIPHSGCGNNINAQWTNNTRLRFAAETIAPGGTCTVTATVTAPSVGTYVNTTSAVTHQINGVDVGTDTASAELDVVDPTPALGLTKQISASASGPWSTYISRTVAAQVYYRFVLENAGDVPLDTLTVTDAALAAKGFDPSTDCVWSPSTLPVASPSVEAISECISTAVSIANSGFFTNTATASALFNTQQVDARQAKATFEGVEPTAVNVGNVRARINSKDNIIVRWRTFSEAQIAGFNVYRKTDTGAWKQINTAFKQAKHPGQAIGDVYRFTDRKTASGKTYRYKIEVKYLDGRTEWTNLVRIKKP